MSFYQNVFLNIFLSKYSVSKCDKGLKITTGSIIEKIFQLFQKRIVCFSFKSFLLSTTMITHKPRTKKVSRQNPAASKSQIIWKTSKRFFIFLWIQTYYDLMMGHSFYSFIIRSFQIRIMLTLSYEIVELSKV